MVLVENDRQNNKTINGNNQNHSNANNSAATVGEVNHGHNNDVHDTEDDDEGAVGADSRSVTASENEFVDTSSLCSTTVLSGITPSTLKSSSSTTSTLSTLTASSSASSVTTVSKVDPASTSTSSTVATGTDSHLANNLNDLTSKKIKTFSAAYLEAFSTPSATSSATKSNNLHTMNHNNNIINSNSNKKPPEYNIDNHITKELISAKENGGGNGGELDNIPLGVGGGNTTTLSSIVQQRKDVKMGETPPTDIMELIGNTGGKDNKEAATGGTSFSITSGGGSALEDESNHRIQRVRSAEFNQRLLIPNNSNQNNNCTDQISNVLRTLSQTSISANVRNSTSTTSLQQHQEMMKLNGGGGSGGVGSNTTKSSLLASIGGSSTRGSLNSLLQSGSKVVGGVENTNLISSIEEQHSNYLNQYNIGTLTANNANEQQQQHITKQSMFTTSKPFTVSDILSGVNNKSEIAAATTTSSFLIGNGGGGGSSMVSATCSPLISILPPPTIANGNVNGNGNGSGGTGQAKVVLICEANSHPFQTRSITLTPNVECMVGRLIAKGKAAEDNAIFDCKVLSRKHAVIWYTNDGKFWVKDTKSSNGTFVNDTKLGDEEIELHFGDIVKFGVDVLENSRKEVHGCIIACIKLYLPDGREAISISSKYQVNGVHHHSHHNRSSYSGESRISLAELHRLNQYVQETAEREKLLTSKLCSIQNILDATRKNSALCWQAMISEDQLLHRIHLLERKLQFMEKNVPENTLRNEVIKLLNEKSTYQHTAKEALRKIYQERCDAMHVLAKVESAYTASDNECALLREQLAKSKQVLQDLNQRLNGLEGEYDEYREEATRKQLEAKENEEQCVAEFSKKLHLRELECDELKRKISELLIKQAALQENREQSHQKMLEKRAIEDFDAMFSEENDDDDEDEEDEDEGEYVDDKGEDNVQAKDEQDAVDQGKDESFDKMRKRLHSSQKSFKRSSRSNKKEMKMHADDQEDKEKSLNSSKKSKYELIKEQRQSPALSSHKRVKESTIMKWLQNSDINKSEDGNSFDVFRAICNNNEDDDEEDSHYHHEGENRRKDMLVDDGDGGGADDDEEKQSYDMIFSDDRLAEKCTNFANKLNDVQRNIQQLETEMDIMENEMKVTEKNDDDENKDENEKGESVEICKKHPAREGFEVIADGQRNIFKYHENYSLLKSSVFMLREACNEIRQTLFMDMALKLVSRPEQISEEVEEAATGGARKALKTATTTSLSTSLHQSPGAARVQTKFQSDSTTATNSNNKDKNYNNLNHSTKTSLTSNDKDDEDTQQIEVNDGENLFTVNTPGLALEDDIQSTTSTSSSVSQPPITVRKVRTTAVQFLPGQMDVEMMVEKEDEERGVKSLHPMNESESFLSQTKIDGNHLKNEGVYDEKRISLNAVSKENDQDNNIATTTTAATMSHQGGDGSVVNHGQVLSPLEMCNTEIYYEINNDSPTSTNDSDLQLMNFSETEREEELIVYKERLEEQERENIRLRNEIASLRVHGNLTDVNNSKNFVGSKGNQDIGRNTNNHNSWLRITGHMDATVRQILPFGVLLMALVAFFIKAYF